MPVFYGQNTFYLPATDAGKSLFRASEDTTEEHPTEGFQSIFPLHWARLMKDLRVVVFDYNFHIQQVITPYADNIPGAKTRAFILPMVHKGRMEVTLLHCRLGDQKFKDFRIEVAEVDCVPTSFPNFLILFGTNEPALEFFDSV